MENKVHGTRLTSIEAYQALAPSLGSMQLQVYRTIKERGNLTNREIGDILGKPANEISGRTNELYKQKLVTEHSRRKCTISGKRVICWKAGGIKFQNDLF